jgi:uncharacterized protein (TIGR03083 family)
MQLAPVYDDETFITIEGPNDDQRAPLVRQRLRLQALLASLSDAQWASPSRCEGWTVRDVVSHLTGTNMFWTASIDSGVAGTPTRFLATFDPVATPAQMVDATRSIPPAETLRQFVDSNQKLFDAVERLDDAGWSATAEAPPGHVSVRVLAHHALWDSWVHERDIALPLGLEHVAEDDELEACMRYAAALGPAIAYRDIGDRRGALVVDATDPDLHYVVEVGPRVAVHRGPAPAGALTIKGRAAEVIDRLSLRAPFADPVPAASRWLLAGLAEAFDAPLESTA